MLVYRVPLPAGVRRLLSASVRPRADRLGVVARFVTADGSVGVHRGALFTPEAGRPAWGVAAYQISGRELFLTLRPIPARPAGRPGMAFDDRIRVPLLLQAWGAEAVREVRSRIRVTCRSSEGWLFAHGVILLTLITHDVPIKIRIPFCRAVTLDRDEPLKWRGFGGVTGLHVRVQPGGRIEGEVVVALRCEGRPRARGPSPPERPRSVREVTGTVARLTASVCAHDTAMAEGSLSLDLFWFDQHGKSRWTGGTAPFSKIIPLPGLREGDRLEARARLLRADHGPPRADGLPVRAMIDLSVTALRPAEIRHGQHRYRAEELVGEVTVTLEQESLFFRHDPEPGSGAVRSEVTLPLASPPGGWQEVAAVASTPELTGSGRWQVRVALGGTPAGEAPFPSPLRAKAGGEWPRGDARAAAVVPGLAALEPGAVKLQTTVVGGPALPAVRPVRSEAAGSLDLLLPGAVDTVLEVRCRQNHLEALVRLRQGGLCVIAGALAEPANLLLALPVLQDGAWYLRCRCE